MKYDFSELGKLIVSRYKTRQAFAKAMKLSASSITYKLDGRREWTHSDIAKAMILLDLKSDEVVKYFFCPMI